MFKVKNKSAKIITVGKVDILPHKVAELGDEFKKNPVIQLFIKKGFLAEIPASASDDKKKTPKQIAASVKKMKIEDVVAQLTELNVEFAEDASEEDLKTLLVEALV